MYYRYRIVSLFVPGHFTQVVWKSSREIGLGRAQTGDGKWLVCANFYPAGNYVGRNAENVFPTRDGKFVLPPKDDLKVHKSGEFDSKIYSCTAERARGVRRNSTRRCFDRHQLRGSLTSRQDNDVIGIPEKFSKQFKLRILWLTWKTSMARLVHQF